jgi:hypothetical protein
MLVERMQRFVLPVSAANVQPQLGLTLRVDLDAPFRLFGVVIWNLGVVAGTGCEGQIAIRIQRPDGRTIQRQITASNQLFPGNQYNQATISANKAWACPIRPGVLFPAGSVIEMDLMGLNTGIANPQGSIVVFVGTNIYQQGQVWNPQYPQKWTPRPYLDNITVQNVAIPGGLPLLSQPFTAQADSDFVWQAGEYIDQSVGGGSLVFSEPDSAASIQFVGVAGTTINLDDANLGTPNQPLTITVVGTVVTMQAGTDALGGLNTSVLQAVNLFNSTPAAAALAVASQLGPGGLPVPSSGVIPGGVGSNVDQLTDLGVIVRDPSYKGYSNTYVPAALLFPFLSAQNPGWLYPEIYIPRLSQLYFDFNYLYPGFTPAASPVTITLGLKGMKVYAQG